MLDIQANRRARKYSNRELALRVVWGAAQPLFRFSPRLLYGWRNALLRLFGAQIGRDVRVHPRARIMFPWQLRIGDECDVAADVFVYNLGRIELGRQVTVSHGVQLCAGTHDHNDPTFPLQKVPIRIEDGAWICTEAFVGPGVTGHAGAIVGARAVAVRNVPARAIVVGNPGRTVGERRLARTDPA